MRYLLITVVAVVHIAVIGGALMIQGCGTTRGPVALPTEHPMPPALGAEELPPPAPTEGTYRPPSIADAAAAAAPVRVTPAPTPRAPVIAPRDANTKSYVVGKGDSLSVIAKRHNVSVPDIMLLNNIKDPNRVRMGQTLKLPASATVTARQPSKPAASTAPVAAAVGSAGTYTVKSGDSLSVIAHRYGVKVKALQEASGLKSDKLSVGQKLVLPQGARLKSETLAAPESRPASTESPMVLPTPAELPAPVPPPVAAPVAAPEMTTPPVAPEMPLPALSPELPPVAATGTRNTYTVKVGDDILSVASDFNVSISELRRVNSLTSDTLVPGRTLIIPVAE